MSLSERNVRGFQLRIGLLAAAACWLALAAAHASGAFDGFDLRLLDLRFRLRGERAASSQIALVMVDDATIRSYGRWPLPRDQFALLLESLGESGARAIGVDLLFADDTQHDSLQNALLAFMGERANVVQSISFLSEAALDPEPRALPPASLAALRRQGIPAPGIPLAGAVGVIAPFPGLMESGAAVGHITVAADRDGGIRRQPQLVQFEDRVYASMSLRMLGAGLGRPGLPRVWTEGGLGVGWDAGPRWRLSPDREGATRIDFAGDRRAFANATSMIHVLNDRRRGDLAGLRRRFGDRYVLIGLDSRTEVTEDVGATPFSSSTPLVFVHANVLDNLLRGRFLTGPSPALYLAGLAGLALVLGWLFAELPLLAAAMAALIATGLLAGLDFALFAWRSIDVPPMAALLLSPALYLAVSSGRYVFLESRTRRRDAEIREGRSIEQQFLPEAMVGRQLTRYQVLEKLGSGGMGIVYRGRDTRLQRDVAIKVLPARALADERTRKRFRREAAALSRISHPRIAGIFDYDSQDGSDFIVMELVTGESLTARLKRGQPAEAEVRRIASQMAEALDAAHARGIVHRDLKPDNVMITPDGNVKVLDFGVAALTSAEGPAISIDSTLTEIGTMVGTVPYMAPEVLRGERAVPASDLYSLGVVMFEMATGRRPFPNDELHELVYTVLNQSPPSARILNGRISGALDAVVSRLLAKNPAARFASATELIEALASGSVVPASTRSDGARHV